ncbi:MAG TPA: CpsB/CapC family capsule biosynthesis tyrosine phosphatase [Candidatus Aquilonibacter sp.]|nr:CpsB/CapC family capsule biosynthesis tyrosine phosphatase [Candidatus Aquilonibacter sp.]
MIDIHCHILPNLDDGADSVETSLAMAEMAIEDGVSHIICTPHSNARYAFQPELIKQRREELQSRFEGLIVFGTGCDFHLSFENLQAIRENPTRFTLNQKNYLLVEFADFSIPPALDQALHNLQLAGLTPIITHPERNPLIRTKPERLFQWLRQGCYAQVTAQSIAGKFGRTAQEAAERWLGAGVFHFIASDAHNVTSRPLRLKETYESVTQNYGEDLAHALLVANPHAAFEGKPLPFVPELLDKESLEAAQSGRRKRFWFF